MLNLELYMLNVATSNRVKFSCDSLIELGGHLDFDLESRVRRTRKYFTAAAAIIYD